MEVRYACVLPVLSTTTTTTDTTTITTPATSNLPSKSPVTRTASPTMTPNIRHIIRHSGKQRTSIPTTPEKPFSQRTTVTPKMEDDISGDQSESFLVLAARSALFDSDTMANNKGENLIFFISVDTF